MFYLKHSFGNTWESPSSIRTPTTRARIAPGGDSAARAAGRVHKGTFRGSSVRAGPASRALASLYPEPFTGHNRATEADFSENVPRAERCVDVLSSRERRGVLEVPLRPRTPPLLPAGHPAGRTLRSHPGASLRVPGPGRVLLRPLSKASSVGRCAGRVNSDSFPSS